MNKKNCIFCNSSNVKKNGHRRNVQMYLCKDCGRQFQGGLRINNVSLGVMDIWYAEMTSLPNVHYA